MENTPETVREGWVNFYPAGAGFITDGGWASRAEADEFAWEGHTRIGCKKIVLGVNNFDLES